LLFLENASVRPLSHFSESPLEFEFHVAVVEDRFQASVVDISAEIVEFFLVFFQ
jgi:hypothetical protein